MGTAANKKPRGAAEERSGLHLSRAKCAGFSLLELIASMVVMLVIVGGIVEAISLGVQTFGRTEQKSDMYENVRGVAELMAQEVGQAGLVSLPTPAPTLSAAVAASAAAQAVNVSSTTSMYVGEKVLVDAGPTEEQVTLTAVTSTAITAVFAKAHASAVPITALGVFPSGIVPPGTTDGSSATVLNIVGDINDDDKLLYVRYTCAPGTTTAPGTLTRSVTTITPGVNTLSASQTLLTTLITNPSSTPCFQYATQTAGGYTFVTQLGITLSAQTLSPDPKTKQYATMTKSFLNLEPRNVLAGLELATSGTTTRLQTAPPNVLVY